MKNIFKKIFKGKVVIVGIGNSLKGDDAFGPLLIDRLKGKIKAVCIDAGSAPENYTANVVKENPDTILIVDAVHLDLKPGEYEILKKSDIIRSGFTTHDISAGMFIEYLKSRTKADVYMLGAQPGNIRLGDEMSDVMKKTLDDLTELITGLGNA